jgi:glyoxylase-like metal-dependent hydrolase (beta-lactamase superfamily II)
MQIIKIYPKGFGSNAYLITKDGQNAIVIDPSTPRVFDEVTKRGLTAQFVLLTHFHFDHTAGVEIFQTNGAKVVCMQEAKAHIGTKADCSWAFGAPPAEYRVDDTFLDNESKTLCGIKVTAWHTPGHTEGSACYFFEDGNERALFTGDTLFYHTVGRVDLPTGDGAKLEQSLARLSRLDDWKIYPGHGEESSIFEEVKNNPFMVFKE